MTQPMALPIASAAQLAATQHPKDSPRAWSVVGAAFVGMLFSVGVMVLYTFGVLSSAMSAEFGWTEVQRSALFVSFSLSSTVAGPIWGAIADRVGPRRVAIGSSLLLAACFCGLAAVPNSTLLDYVLFASMGIFGSGTLPPIFASVVVVWFERHRGLALGITMVGVGVGAAVLPAIAARIVTQYGWREMCMAYAAMILLLSLPVAAMFLRAYPDADVVRTVESRAIRATLSMAMRESRFWILVVFAFMTGLILVGAVANFVPLLQSRGESLVQAAQYQSTVGISLIVGRLIGGSMLDRVFAPRVVTFVLLVTAAGFAVLHEASSSAAYVLAAIGIGLAVGTEIDFLGFVVSRYYGRAAFTTIFALLFAVYSLGGSAGPPLFAWMYHATGGYGFGLLAFAGIALILAALMFTLPRYTTDGSKPSGRQ